MKTLFACLIIVLFSSSGIAQIKESQESTFLKIKSGEEVTTYQFNSVRDLEENSEKILDEISSGYQPDKKEKTYNLTIEISLTAFYSDKSTTITGSVTAPHTTIISEVKVLRSKLIAIIGG